VDSINSATLRVRANIEGIGANADEVTWACTVANHTEAATEFYDSDGTEGEKTDVLTTPTVSSLNAATIEVEQTLYNAIKGNDGSFFRIEFIEIEVDYNAGVVDTPKAPPEITPDPVLTGKVPIMMQTHSASPPVLDPGLDIAGKVPTAFRQDYVDPLVLDPGLDIAGKIPVIRQTWSAAPTERDLVLAGKVPEAIVPVTETDIVVPHVERRLVTLRGLQLFGYPPTILHTLSAIPAEDDLVIAGKIPTAFRRYQPSK